METKPHTVSVTLRDPADLRLHPLQKNLPEPDKQSPEWLSFVDGLMSAGPEALPPLIITREGQIMDGGRRWRAARQLQWARIPTVERPEAEAAALIVDTLLGQRNLPRGTKVYLTLALLPDFVKSSESRRLDNLRRGVKNGSKPLIFPNKSHYGSGDGTVAEFCARLGVSEATYLRAREVNQLFIENPNFRVDYEADLLSGEKSLWNVLSAIKGASADQSKREPSKEASQLELFTGGINQLGKAGKHWSRWDDDKKEKVLTSWRAAIAEFPAELRDELRAALTELE